MADAANDFPPWQTVYWWFRRFVRRFMFQTIHDVALMLDRERMGREASSTGDVIDSQSVKLQKLKQGDTTRARRSWVASATSRSTPTAVF